jgi:hypothetical protein
MRETSLDAPAHHQQPEVNYLPRFSPQLISLERNTLSVYRAWEIDLFEHLDIVHIRLLVADTASVGGHAWRQAVSVQGYLAHKKHNLPKTLQYDYT